jgi:hypothetical protein
LANQASLLPVLPYSKFGYQDTEVLTGELVGNGSKSL